MKRFLFSFFLLVSLVSQAQVRPPSNPPTLTYRQRNTNQLDMIISSAGTLLTPSSSVSITAEVRLSDVGRIVANVPMTTVDTIDGTIRGMLPNLDPSIYYLGLYIRYASGDPEFRVGVGRLEIVPTGSLRVVTDASGLNIQISEVRQVLNVKLDATPSSAIAAYYAQQVRADVAIVNQTQATAQANANAASQSAADALSSKNSAVGSASTATTKAGEAATSAGQALTSKNNAATSEANASTSKNAAGVSADSSLARANRTLTYRNAAKVSADSASAREIRSLGYSTTSKIFADSTLARAVRALAYQNTSKVNADSTLARANRALASQLASKNSETNSTTALTAAQAAANLARLGMPWKGAWVANVTYLAGDGVSNGGNSYRRKADGVSGSSFDASNWDVVALGGSVADLGITTPKLADAAVDHTKSAYYQGRLVGSRKITVDLQAKTLTVSAGTIVLAGKTVITLPTGMTDISTELNLNPSFSKFCYWDLTTSTLQFKDFTTTTQPNCVLVFVLNANVITAINPQAVVVLNASGTEVWPISAVPTDGSITTAKMATAAVDHTKSAYYQGRLLGNRLITVNAQARTLVVAANTYVLAGKTIISIPAGTTDISTELNTNPANVKLCYWDLSTSSLQFKDFGSTTTANCVMLFYLYNNVITAINGGAIIVINSSGTEVWPIASSSVPADGSIGTVKLANAAVDYTKTSYFQGRVLGNRKITVSLLTKTMIIGASTSMLAGKSVINLPAGTTDISTELNLNPGYSKFCYWDLGTSSLQFKDFTTTVQPNSVLLFILDGTMIHTSSARAIVLLDASGVEVVQNSFSASQLTTASIDYTKNYTGDETNERLVLPDSMYFIAGEKLPIYKAQIIGGRDYLEQLKVAVCNEPTGGTPSYNFFYEDYQLDPSVLLSQFRFYLRQSYNLDYAYYKPIYKISKPASAVSGKSVKILHIGDSITEGAIPMWLRNKLTGYGVTVTTLGTRGINSSEGRGSWNTGHLIGRKNFVENTVITRVTNLTATGKYQNPFLKVADATDKANYPQYCFRNTGATDELNYLTDTDKTGNFYIFDFTFYLSNTSTATPDVVTIAHLTNNLGPLIVYPYPDAAPLYQQLDDEMEFIIRQVYLAAPSVKMGIIPQPAVGFAGTGGNMRWKINSIGVDRLGAKVRSLKSTFPKLYLVGVWPHINPDATWTYTTTASPLNAYNNSIKQQKNENLHPNDFGRAEYANALAAWFVNIL